METLELIKNLCKLTELSAYTVMVKTLKKYYPRDKVRKGSHYIIAEGDIPIALTAHLDTVFSKPAAQFFYDSDKDVMWSPEGLGTDDRAGLAMIIEIIHAGYRPHIILTRGEEIGGLGAKMIIRKHHNIPFKDLRYVIQLDRRGENDCVFYDCNNPKFVNYVQQFGFKYNTGTFTDISIICPTWKIAGVNLSVGYVNEHSASEHFYFKHYLSTRDRVMEMLSEEIDTIPTFEYIKDTRDYFDFTGGLSQFAMTCSSCHETMLYWDGVDISGEKPEDSTTVCYECFSKMKGISLCGKCGDWYYERKGKNICADCEVKTRNGGKNYIKRA